MSLEDPGIGFRFRLPERTHAFEVRPVSESYWRSGPVFPGLKRRWTSLTPPTSVGEHRPFSLRRTWVQTETEEAGSPRAIPTEVEATDASGPPSFRVLWSSTWSKGFRGSDMDLHPREAHGAKGCASIQGFVLRHKPFWNPLWP